MHRVSIFIVMVLMMSFCACGSSSTGSPTSSGVELFPTSVAPDASDVTPATVTLSQSTNPNLGKTLGMEGDFSGPIMASTGIVQYTSLFTDAIFSAIATGCNSLITDTSTSVDCTATLDGSSWAVHIDFRCFDYDGDGTKDDCSGTANPTASKAAMFRVWVGTAKTRLMAGKISTVPTFSGGVLTVAGAGQGTIKPSVIYSGFNSNVTTKGIWTQTETGSLTFEGYATGTMPSFGTQVPDMDIMHFTVTRATSGSVTTNTLKCGGKFTSSAVVGPVATPFYQVQMVSQWRTGGGYIEIKNNSYNIDGTLQEGAMPQDTSLCAEIATGSGASTPPTTLTLCADEGLDISSEAYLSKDLDDDGTTALTSTLAAFPSTTEFPEDYATITN